MVSEAQEEKRVRKRREKVDRAASTQRAIDAAALDSLVRGGKLRPGNDPSWELEWVSTGIEDLDKILGGGMPRRRITILLGEYASAKTFLIQMLIKQAISMGLKAAYIDAERSYDPAWWAQVGIPLDKILVSQPPSGEAAIDVMVALARANVDVIALDSMAALIPSEELGDEASAENKNIASQSRLIAKMMRMLIGLETNSVMVMANQVREIIGGPMPGVTMPGGKAPKHFSSIILRVRREQWIKEQERRVGFHIRCQVQKNKVAQPWGECLLPFRFRGEIDMVALLVDRAIEAGIIEQKGPWFTLQLEDVEQKALSGRNKMIELLTEDDALKARVEKALG
jgi:recombination protein RecA